MPNTFVVNVALSTYESTPSNRRSSSDEDCPPTALYARLMPSTMMSPAASAVPALMRSPESVMVGAEDMSWMSDVATIFCIGVPLLPMFA